MITERDIFNYVFFRELVSAEMIDDLTTNEHYVAAIEFYKELKLETERHLTLKEKKNLAAKIPLYKFAQKIELLPFQVSDMKNEIRLAANSKISENKVRAVSYVSETKEFLCRIVTSQTRQLLYCFSTDDEELKEFTVTLFPGETEIHCKSNAEPMAVPTNLTVEKITLDLC